MPGGAEAIVQASVSAHCPQATLEETELFG